MSIAINRVVLVGNLTRDPEKRTIESSGKPVCHLRIACNGRRRTPDGGWVDRAHYFDVSVFGAQAENCHRFLSKGRPIAIDGRLEWREWEATNQGKRQSVSIVAETVQFLGSPPARSGEQAGAGETGGAGAGVEGGGESAGVEGGNEPAEGGGEGEGAAPARESAGGEPELEPVGAGAGSEDPSDLPF